MPFLAERASQAVAWRVRRGANRLLARPPKFVITGTGRCGTSYAATYLSALGIRCSHEGYFTPDGPKLRNPSRSFGTQGDVSWLAAPFVANLQIPVVHLVRQPLNVILSLHSIGFFDRRFRGVHGPFIAFAERHFDAGEEPIDACVRWYLDWNKRCERVSGLRIQVEHFKEQLPVLLSYIGAKPTRAAVPPSPKVNAWQPVDLDAPPRAELERQVREHPLAGELAVMAGRYGYSEAD